ncbi:MAG: S24/S26 family peptidase [Clostridia bacterium]|nr:S24/S26 family peptidase [Clostridia bacterium]
MRESFSLDELYPLIADVIARGESFRLYPRGTSMQPMLYEGRDSVLLGAADRIETGDVLLYRRTNGAFVLHRLIEKRGGKLTMCGDHQCELEYGIAEEQVLAKVVGYYVGEEYRPMDSAEYQKYMRSCVRRFPFYRRDPKLLGFLRKIKHTLCKKR